MTSPLAAVCPHCDKKLKVKNPELIGKKVKCPGCSQPFRLQPVEEETYSLAKPPADPQPAVTDDEWISALGEAAQSGQPLESASASAGLPPAAGKPKKKKKKKKKPREFGAEPIPGSDEDDRYGYRMEEGMSRGLIGALIGGGIAGLIGALIWGGIAYATLHEHPYTALGVGALVGFGVLLGAQEYAGVTTGIAALVLANLSMFFGKCFAYSWLILHDTGINPLYTPFRLMSFTVQMLDPYDGIWIVVASFIAYRVGSNEVDDD